MSPDGADARPRGRDEVVAALLAAATQLFAERGPASVSLRDVATAANVNVGLIHRHIGSKDDLLAAVLRARPGLPIVPAADAPDLDAVARALLAGVDSAGYTRLVARVVLDGYDLISLQGGFPLVDFAVAALEERLPAADAAVRAAFLASTILGWHLFAPVALAIVGQGDRPPDEVAALLAPALDAFIAAGSPSPPTGGD